MVMSVLQASGRKLLAGDGTQNKGSSYGDLFLQSYGSCEYPPTFFLTAYHHSHMDRIR